MEIVVNGRVRTVRGGPSLAGLLAELGFSVEHVAVERNGRVVESSEFDSTMLAANDRLEIVRFVGGG